MTIYLYVKTHNKTGLKYLGKTSNKDPHKYTGSGKYWKLHLKKHGRDFKTEILLETDDKNKIKEFGLYFSRLWNIVESNEWANLKPEEGDGGAPLNSNIWINNGKNEKMVKDESHIPKGYVVGRLPEIGKKIIKNRKKFLPWNKGKKMKDSAKMKLSTSKKKFHEENDMIWITNGTQEKMIKNKDSIENNWYIGRSNNSKDKLGNLIWINNGKQQKRIKKDDDVPDGWTKGNIKDQKGIKNPSYGKIWINNGIENKFINKDEEIPLGYIKGRLSWRS